MLKGYKKQIKFFSYYIFLSIKIALIFFLLVFSLYHLAFSNRTLPGLFVSNVSFSGLNKTQVEQKLSDINTFTLSQWQLVVGDHSYSIDANDIGYEFNMKEMGNQLFLLGREKNILLSFKTKFISLTTGYKLLPIYNINQEKYNKFVNNVIENSTLKYTDAKFILDDNENLVISPDQNGYTVSEKEIKDVIDNRYLNFNTDSKKILNLEIVSPQVKSELLTLYFDKISNFLGREIKFKYKDKEWIPTIQEKLDMVSVTDKIIVNRDQLFLKEIVDFVNSPKTVEVFEVENGKVTKFIPAGDGIVVDEKTFLNILIEAINNPDIITLEVPVQVSPVAKGINEYGIKELIGSGETTYFHSAANRVFNVNLAASRVTGVLVAPEEVFSFANTVGEVSATSGYKQGYIIYNNKTILGDGGGLCQVSTTLFRAILDAGLPVVSRTGHAYRVSYYEQNSDPGFDATVYVPSVDLKFKNDTGNYLLIISESKPDEYYLKYSIYGTNDGRKVTITKPVVTSVSKPPEPVYQDEATLPKGVVKQIEWATWGANVEFSRTVEREGKVLYQDLFKTNYSPWANAYLVGTKE